MKSFYLLFLTIIIPTFLLAQIEQSIQTTVEVASYEEQQFIPFKDCFACTQGEVKRAFRFGYSSLFLPNERLLNLTNTPFFIPLGSFFEFEQKINTSFSINTNLELQNVIRNTPILESTIRIDNELSYQYFEESYRSIGLYFEPRWYIGKKQAVEKKLSGNNFNGAYLGLNLGINSWSSGKYVPPSDAGITKTQFFGNAGVNQYAILNIGWQHRLRGFGFINFRLGAGFNKATQNLSHFPDELRDFFNAELGAKRWRTLLYYQVNWGFLLGNKRANLPENTLKFWEYHEEENQMWKIDLYNVLQGFDQKGGFGRLHVAYERKISNRPFSLETGLQYHYFANTESDDFSNQFVLRIEPRYYFLLNKHIRQGKAANNLSSTYFGFQTEWHFGQPSLTREGDNLFYDLTFGRQQRMFKRLFMDLKVGFGFNELTNDKNPFFYDIRFGFAF